MEEDKNYEKDLLESYDAGEWESIEDLEENIVKYMEYAADTLRED